MNICPKCGGEMPAGVQKCPGCGFEMTGTPVGEAEDGSGRAAARGVPNIPRREPDSLPERPERSGSSGNKGTVILAVLAVLLILILIFLMKK